MRVPHGPPEPRSIPLDRRGFTILELMVAIMVVTLTAAVSMWAYFARPEVTLDNAAQLLVRDMRVAQARAALLRAPVTLVFNLEGDGYRVFDGMEDMANPRYLPERIERSYSRDAVFEGVSILPLGLAARGKIVFDTDHAEPASGSITLSYERATRIVEMEAGTGHVLLTGH